MGRNGEINHKRTRIKSGQISYLAPAATESSRNRSLRQWHFVPEGSPKHCDQYHYVIEQLKLRKFLVSCIAIGDANLVLHIGYFAAIVRYFKYRV